MCIRCGARCEVGGLCERHVNVLATCSDITAEQLLVRPIAEPSGYLVDQWGATRAIGEITTVGRDSNGCELAILHASVSTTHALLECGDAEAARISDRGSLNGTFVNDERITRERLFDGDVLRFGEVSFYFTLGTVDEIQVAHGSGRTVPSRVEDLTYTVSLQVAARTLVVSETSAGGVGSVDGSEITFGRLEFDLLKELIERSREALPPSASYLSSRELSERLRFQSQIADSDNVRELVRRVRRKIKKAGLEDLIQSRQGAGYRLAWPIRSR